MIQSIYLLYLTVSLFIMLFWNKIPKPYQAFGIVALTTLVSNINPNTYGIFDAINDFKAGKISTLDLVWSFFSAYLVSWDIIDADLKLSIDKIVTNKIYGYSGVLLFSLLDTLYLFSLTLFIYGWLSLFRGIFKWMLNSPIKPSDQLEELIITIVSSILSVIIGYIFIGFEGYVALIKFIIKKLF